MKRLGEGFIILHNGSHDGITFLVDGNKIVDGHIVYLAKGEFRNEGEPYKTTWMIKKKDGRAYIQFYVHYITHNGTQGVQIPYTEKNLQLFKDITRSHNGSFIAFKSDIPGTIGMINGIGTTWYSNHKTKQYGGRWLFWNPK